MLLLQCSSQWKLAHFSHFLFECLALAIAVFNPFSLPFWRATVRKFKSSEAVNNVDRRTTQVFH